LGKNEIATVHAVSTAFRIVALQESMEFWNFRNRILDALSPCRQLFSAALV
jgi:hypothetical protein